MDFKKSVLIISLLLILSVSIGMVSVSSDIVLDDVDSEDVSAVSVDQVVDESDEDESLVDGDGSDEESNGETDKDDMGYGYIRFDPPEPWDAKPISNWKIVWYIPISDDESGFGGIVSDSDVSSYDGVVSASEDDVSGSSGVSSSSSINKEINMETTGNPLIVLLISLFTVSIGLFRSKL